MSSVYGLEFGFTKYVKNAFSESMGCEKENIQQNSLQPCRAGQIATLVECETLLFTLKWEAIQTAYNQGQYFQVMSACSFLLRNPLTNEHRDLVQKYLSAAIRSLCTFVGQCFKEGKYQEALNCAQQLLTFEELSDENRRFLADVSKDCEIFLSWTATGAALAKSGSFSAEDQELVEIQGNQPTQQAATLNVSSDEKQVNMALALAKQALMQGDFAQAMHLSDIASSIMPKNEQLLPILLWSYSSLLADVQGNSPLEGDLRAILLSLRGREEFSMKKRALDNFVKNHPASLAIPSFKRFHDALTICQHYASGVLGKNSLHLQAPAKKYLDFVFS